MMNFRENEEAVSPVIGVILMVAITVILAAVIAAFVFGMTGNVQTQKNVAIGLQKSGENLQLTIQGGADVANLDYLRVTIGDVTYNTTATDFKLVKTASASRTFAVGQIFETNETSGPLDTPQTRVVVAGHFKDGQEQMLTDRTL